MSLETPSNNPPPRKPPFFGVFSLVFPVFGIAVISSLAHSAGRYGNDSWGLGGAIIFILGGFLSLFGGLISAIIGLARGEKYSFVSLLGLFLNAAVLLYVMTYDSRHHHS